VDARATASRVVSRVDDAGHLQRERFGRWTLSAVTDRFDAAERYVKDVRIGGRNQSCYMQIVMIYCSATAETKGQIRQAGLGRPGQLEIAEWNNLKRVETQAGGDCKDR